ncbi:hypothetical protein [Nitratireductor aquibiodomus]|uniref:hypothetical protein n=1 Tax=Nitratireductor aquibiodomus TaxID=204799 RepID=UPI000AB57D6A
MARSPDKKNGGFAEAPQPALSGTPLSGSPSGSIADWADEIAQEAEKPAKPKKPKKPAGRSASASKTARGTSMGGAASAKERAAAGLMPVAGLDVTLEEAEGLSSSGVTATVAALSKLIEGGDPNLQSTWTPHRPARPEKSEGGIPLRMATEFQPSGDQPRPLPISSPAPMKTSAHRSFWA